MGGPGSMRNWVLAGLGQGDHIHFTSPGYQRLGQALFEDLMRLYDRFVRARMEAAEDGNGK
jgi:lysophospholipase L1-like esterase